jgi:hypothetical protein
VPVDPQVKQAHEYFAPQLSVSDNCSFTVVKRFIRRDPSTGEKPIDGEPKMSLGQVSLDGTMIVLQPVEELAHLFVKRNYRRVTTHQLCLGRGTPDVLPT